MDNCKGKISLGILTIVCILGAAQQVDAAPLICWVHEREVGGVCEPCPFCPAGEGLDKRCGYGDGDGAVCRPCIDGKEYSKGSRCLTCIRCAAWNREELHECHSKSNTVCGDCLNGYYPIYKGSECYKCQSYTDHPHCLQKTPAPPTITGKTRDNAKDSPEVPYQHHNGYIAKTPFQEGKSTTTTSTPAGGYWNTNVHLPIIAAVLLVIILIFAVAVYLCKRKKSEINFSEAKTVDMKEILSEKENLIEGENLTSTDNEEGKTQQSSQANHENMVMKHDDQKQYAEPDLEDSMPNLGNQGGQSAQPRHTGIESLSTQRHDQRRHPRGVASEASLGGAPDASQQPNTKKEFHDQEKLRDALYKAKEIKVAELQAGIKGKLNLHLRNQNFAGDKNFTYVAEEVGVGTYLERMSFKSFDDVCRLMVHKDMKLDVLVQALNKLERFDALSDLIEWILVYAREKEGDVRTGGVSESGEDAEGRLTTTSPVQPVMKDNDFSTKKKKVPTATLR